MYVRNEREISHNVDPLNAKWNSICRLLALLGVHHIFHVSRVRAKEGIRNTMK